MLRRFTLAIALTCALTTLLVGPGSVWAATVERTVLFDQLWGFGKDTTGGLGGEIYVVTTTADTGAEGSLRYAIESRTDPVWIVFDENVFPPGKRTILELDAPLLFNFRDNVTIDGRGSYVTLRRVLSGPCIGAGTSPVVWIHSSKNIVLTHLDLLRLYASDNPLDKDACGDIVQITNTRKETELPHVLFDRIWINQSSFYDCGDECIGMGDFNAFERTYMTISRNAFIGVRGYSESGIGAGNGGVEKNPFGLALTLYRNRFYNLLRRLPTLTHGYLRAYNNAFENWDPSGVIAHANTRVMIENNVFRSTSSLLKENAWMEVEEDDVDSFIWARDNLFWTSSGTCPTPPGGTDSACETASFPDCSIVGGPWYYDCDEPMWQITDSGSFDLWLNVIRNGAGWKHDDNDVRDLVPVSESGSFRVLAQP